MRKYTGIVFLLILILLQREGANAFSMADSVGLKDVKGKKFILYKVEQGDGWYGIGHKYGLTASEVQDANEPDKDKPLRKGQILLIPTGKVVTTARETKAVEAGEKPIVYKVKKGETLYSLAVKNGQTMADIRHWNDLKSDTLKPGQKLVIGYENKKGEKNKPASVTGPVVKVTDQPKPAPVVKTDTVIIAEKNQRDEVVKNNLPDSVKKEAKEEWKMPKAKGAELEERGIASFIEDEDINPNKYYALHRTAPKGTIIKLTNIMNKKQIYVKVIGSLPNTGDNNDLIIKISKAGAMKLNVLDSRFQVVLNYFGQ